MVGRGVVSDDMSGCDDHDEMSTASMLSHVRDVGSVIFYRSIRHKKLFISLSYSAAIALSSAFQTSS